MLLGRGARLGGTCEDISPPHESKVYSIMNCNEYDDPLPVKLNAIHYSSAWMPFLLTGNLLKTRECSRQKEDQKEGKERGIST